MQQEDWNDLENQNLNLLTPNEADSLFINKFQDNFDQSFNLKNSEIKKCIKGKLNPWVTKSLIKACWKKSLLLNIFKKTRTHLAKIKYIKYKNILKQAIRHEEKIYYEKQFAP